MKSESSTLIAGLAEEALARLKRPYPPDVVDQVFLTIQENEELHGYYLIFCIRYGTASVNRRLGHFTAMLTGMSDTGATQRSRSRLVRTVPLLA